MRLVASYIVVCVTLSAWLCSCSPQQRMNRLAGNHPELAQARVVETRVTIHEVDTITVPEVVIDTVFDFCTDTVFYAKQGPLELNISKQGKGYKVLSRSNAFQIYYRDTCSGIVMDTIYDFTIQPVSSYQIWTYRKEGAGVLLIVILILIAAYYAVRFYLKGQTGGIL